MKKTLLISILLAASAANAQFDQYRSHDDAMKAIARCHGPVTLDETRMVMVDPSNLVHVVGVNDAASTEIQLLETPKDLKIRGHILYALFANKIQEWDVTTQALVHEAPTTLTDAMPEFKAHAMGMAFAGEKLVIAHGRAGYAIYDLASHSITSRQLLLQDKLPEESAVVDVAVSGNNAIFLVDNVSYSSTHFIFRGFIVVDLTTGKELHRNPGIDAGAESLEIVGNSVMVSFGGPIHMFKLDEVLKGKRTKIRWIVMKYDKQGHPVSHGTAVGTKLYTCFILRGEPAQNGVQRLPMVVNLPILK